MVDCPHEINCLSNCKVLQKRKALWQKRRGPAAYTYTGRQKASLWQSSHWVWAHPEEGLERAHKAVASISAGAQQQRNTSGPGEAMLHSTTSVRWDEIAGQSLLIHCNSLLHSAGLHTVVLEGGIHFHLEENNRNLGKWDFSSSKGARSQPEDPVVGGEKQPLNVVYTCVCICISRFLLNQCGGSFLTMGWQL